MCHTPYLITKDLFQWVPFSKLLCRTQISSVCPLWEAHPHGSSSDLLLISLLILSFKPLPPWSDSTCPWTDVGLHFCLSALLASSQVLISLSWSLLSGGLATFLSGNLRLRGVKAINLHNLSSLSGTDFRLVLIALIPPLPSFSKGS